MSYALFRGQAERRPTDRRPVCSYRYLADGAERDLCRPSGAAPERGNPACRRGRNQEQWFFPPFCRNKKGVAVKAKPVVAAQPYSDLHDKFAPSADPVHDLKSLCAFTARHFGFGQSNQSHCSGLGPCGVPSFRCRSTGPRRWAVPGPAALARLPASLPGSATPPLGLHQRRVWRCLDWRCMQGGLIAVGAPPDGSPLCLSCTGSAGGAERDLCRPSGGVAQGETSHGWRVSAAGPGTAHRRGPRSSAGAREPEGPKPGAMVSPPFLPKQKGDRRKGETGSGRAVASGSVQQLRRDTTHGVSGPRARLEIALRLYGASLWFRPK
jgi:hypothetical protein